MQDILNMALPQWELLPDIGLYMDQVITLMDRTFSPALPKGEMTKSMVNNYVKQRVVPAKSIARLKLKCNRCQCRPCTSSLCSRSLCSRSRYCRGRLSPTGVHCRPAPMVNQTSLH